ncbi:MAG TPA: class I SAM-dependent methyltransferase, partial [Acidimicrobiales bacterium]
RRGAGYDDAMSRWPGARREELDLVAERAAVSAGEVVVDVPAGGGWLADHLPHGTVIVAVEPSGPFSERCAARSGVQAVQAPITATTLDPASADVVVSLAGLHHVADHREAYAEFARILRPGGRLVIADVAVGSPVARFLDGFVDRHNSEGHHGRYLGPDLAAQVAAAGFDAVRVDDVDHHWRFDGREDMVLFATLLFGLDRATPADVEEGLASHLGWQPDGAGIALAWGLRVATARRSAPSA